MSDYFAVFQVPDTPLEVPVGALIEVNKVTFQCLKKETRDCASCDLEKYHLCNTMLCFSNERKDRNEVLFEEVDL